MTEQSEIVGGATYTEGGTGTLSRGGLFHSRYAFNIPTTEVIETRREAANLHKPFTRKVGLHYSLQTMLNGLPLLVVDILALTFTVATARLIFHYLKFTAGVDVSAALLPIATGFVLLNLELGLYPGIRLSPVEELRRLSVSISCMFIVWGIGVAVLKGGWSVPWTFLLVMYLACLLVLPVARGWARSTLGRWTRWGIPVLVCGDDPSAVKLFHWLSDNRQLGLRPVGVIADRESLDIGPDDAWYLGGWENVHDVAVARGIYWAVVVPREDGSCATNTLIADYLYAMPHVHILSSVVGMHDHWNPQRLDGLTGIHLQQNLMLPLPQMMKRCVDLAGTIAGGMVLLPLFFYLAVAVKLSSRGPIIYGHERIGKNGRRFKAWKFRTMFQHADLVLEQYLEDHPELQEEWQKDHKLRYDPRVTRIGRFMRKTSLDELPQLWNVLRGDMSLVGPRPIVTAEIEKYGSFYGLYTMVTPGITGLWQVSGRNNTTYEERVQFDVYYVRNWSPWMDLYLLLRTIRIVIFAKGAY